MKTLIISIFLLICSTHLFAQDIITLKSGEEIKAKVTEIANTEIKYKKFDNQSGPAYVLQKSEIFMIKYENGEKEVFTNANTSNRTTRNNSITSNQPIDVTGERRGFIGITLGAALPIGDMSDWGAKTGFNFNLIKYGYLFNPNFGIGGSWMGNAFSFDDGSGTMSYGCLSIGGLGTVYNGAMNFDFKGELGYMYANIEDNYGNSVDNTGLCFILGAGMRYPVTQRLSLMGNLDFVTGKVGDANVSSINISGGIAFKIGKTF